MVEQPVVEVGQHEGEVKDTKDYFLLNLDAQIIRIDIQMGIWN
jgi:hypothetical protein